VATLVSTASPSSLPPSVPPSTFTARNEAGYTLLHIAAEGGKENWVEALLERGCDPSTLDHRDRPAYFLCKNKLTRDAFRRVRGREEGKEGGRDWERSGVPEGLTEEGEKRKKEKAKEKKKRAKGRKKESKQEGKQEGKEEGEDKEGGGEEGVEEGDSQKLLCDACGKRIHVFFSRLEYVYCSTDCVQTHKRTLMAEAALKRFAAQA